MPPRIFWSLLLLAPLVLRAETFPAEHLEFFETSVRPVLAERCVECHGKVRAEGGLRLDTLEGVLQGGDGGKAVNRSRPEESMILLAVRHAGADQGISDMPEKGPKLGEDEVQALERWIALGLPWTPAASPLLAGRDPRDHWSFQSRRIEAVPDGVHPVDHFIRKSLRIRGLAPAPRADPATWVRRLHFALTGLPATRDDMERWTKRSPEELVDHLLASPHYGERWGRHWLDVARYSDVRGYTAGGKERRYVYAYTYRDWVIRALNEDVPYDRFVQYQLAAEQLVSDSGPDRRHLAAMGFLTLSDDAARREVMIDDQIDATFRGLMGLTVACARCHDHKFDPIPTRDYYSLYSVFDNSLRPQEMPLLAEPANSEGYRAYQAGLEENERRIDEFLEPLLAELAPKHPELANRPAQLEEKLAGDDRRKLRDLRTARDRFVAESPHAPDRALILRDRQPPSAAFVFVRGNPGQRGERVQPKFLSALAGDDAPPFAKGSGRLELAQAITDPANPLTARVIVNRVWMHHFGEGLVRTPSDFGVQGEAPDHPELLDWLADWFVNHGWSLKQLHRLLLTSETWLQSAVHPKAVAQELIDPENRLWWRAQRRRVDFETMRDSILAVSGTLDRKLYGRSVEITEEPFPTRRTLYAYIDRQNLPPVFTTFDFANPQAHVAQRSYTTVATQALFTMNHPFLLGQAKALAALPDVASASSAADRVHALHRRVFARDASSSEVELGTAFLDRQKAAAAGEGQPQNLTPWEFGFVEPTEGQGMFQRFAVWKDQRWQPEAAWPASGSRSHLTLTRSGGHPGGREGMATSARWTAPEALSVLVDGDVRKPSDKGDGIRARVVRNGRDILAEVVCPPGARVPVRLGPLALQAGETLEFRLDPMERHDHDSFEWNPVVRDASRPQRRWEYARDFTGPTEWASPAEIYAQALLLTNEFFFVD